MRLFDRELQRRGAAERTRRAYGADLAHLALWSSLSDVEPGGVDHAELQRYAAQLAARGAGPRAVTRKLAAIRSFFTAMVELGEMPATPAEPPPPEQLQALPVAALLNRLPATTPLELRDRAMFELAHSCGLGPDELVRLDLEGVDFDAEQVRVHGRGKIRVVAAGEPVLRSIGRYLERGRPALAAVGGCSALLLSKSGRRLSTSDVRRRLRAWGRLGSASVPTTPDYTRIESARLRAAYSSSHPRA